MSKKIFDKAFALCERYSKKAKTSQGQSRCAEVTLHTDGYAEHGYTDPKSGVIALGNWNTISRWNADQRKSEDIDSAPADLASELEKLGVELEWNDEWITCDDCYKLVRNKPDSYHWRQAYWETDNGITCHECIKKDPSEYLSALEGQDSSCLTIDIDLSEHGYKQLQGDFQNGFHEGQAADPKRIAAALREQDVERFIFVLDEASQFYITFSVWVHETEYDRIDMSKWKTSKKDADVSPAENLRRSLQSAKLMMDSKNESGIQVIQCNNKGGATVKIVSPQDFIDGKALE